MATKKKRKKPPVVEQPHFYAVDRDWFHERTKDAGLSLRGAAREIGLDPSSFNRTLKGARKMQVHELAKLIQLLHVPADEALGRLGFPIDNVTVPIVGRITQDGEISTMTPRKGETLPAPPGAPAGLQAYVFDTAGSPLALWDQSIAFVLPRTSIAAEDVGRLAVIECAGRKHALFGSAIKGAARGRMRIVPFNNGQPFESEHCSASPVIWIKTA